MTDQTIKRITVDAPSDMTILAARHLDAAEGPVQVGSTVDTSARSAITTVLRYIAKAHGSPAAPFTAHERADQLAAVLAEVLQAFSPVSSHNGIRIGWTAQHPIHPDDYDRWNAVLNGKEA